MLGFLPQDLPARMVSCDVSYRSLWENYVGYKCVVDLVEVEVEVEVDKRRNGYSSTWSTAKYRGVNETEHDAAAQGFTPTPPPHFRIASILYGCVLAVGAAHLGCKSRRLWPQPHAGRAKKTFHYCPKRHKMYINRYSRRQSCASTK